MNSLQDLLQSNRDWAARKLNKNPEYFKALAEQQTPECLWIGCSDSRVPATQIVGRAPGEMFVHRNIANLVIHSDINCLSVTQYAVEVLKVKNIIVCGHYGCGGVRAAIDNQPLGLIDNWIRHVTDILIAHRADFDKLANVALQSDMLCQLNVIEQAYNVCRTSIVQAAWARGQNLTVHGWIYGLSNGVIEDLGINVDCDADIGKKYKQATQRVLDRYLK